MPCRPRGRWERLVKAAIAARARHACGDSRASAALPSWQGSPVSPAHTQQLAGWSCLGRTRHLRELVGWSPYPPTLTHPPAHTHTQKSASLSTTNGCSAAASLSSAAGYSAAGYSPTPPPSPPPPAHPPPPPTPPPTPPPPAPPPASPPTYVRPTKGWWRTDRPTDRRRRLLQRRGLPSAAACQRVGWLVPHFPVSSCGCRTFYSCHPKQALAGVGQPGGRAGVVTPRGGSNPAPGLTLPR